MHDALKYENEESDPRVISYEGQFKELTNWLKKVARTGRKDPIKFVVSPVPLFPDLSEEGRLGAPLDKWAAGVWQRHELLEFIRTKEIKKVVFLSGDVHASSIAELTYKK